jgi:Holliday junction resolvase
MPTQARSEQEFTRRLAEEFRAEGFRAVDPAQLRKELPAGYIPDLLFQRGDEILVVEAKSQEEHRSLEQVDC